VNPSNIQTPEQMIERWMGVMCSCDPDVGHLCECCHDTHVVREVLTQQAQLQLERDACADAMDQEHIRVNITEHERRHEERQRKYMERSRNIDTLGW
jgi:hypothetical protein